LSGLGRYEPENFGMSSDSEDEDNGDDTWPRIVNRNRRATVLVPPTVCLTHSSFQAPSVLDVEFSSHQSAKVASSSSSSSSVPPKNYSRPAALPAKFDPASSSASSVRRPQSLPPSSQNRAARDSSSSAAFPALDPTLAALEKSCRLKSKAACVACSTMGYDFPKDRHGRAICSRECRMVLKATEMGAVALPTTVESDSRDRVLAPMLRAL